MTQTNLQPARVRFAPSPTGHLHLGGARTALYDYLLARQTGGQFVLRIEDTDRKRLVEGAEQELIDGLRWLGLDYDEGPDIGGPYGPYRQSERKEIYQHYAKQLVDAGYAYYCFCTPDRLERVRQEQQARKEASHYDGTCRNLDPDEAARRIAAGEKYVIRFKTPKEGTTTVTDVVRGPITVENRVLDDYIIVKSDGLALYHLAAAVDDHLMKITHVIRGSEWLPTFPLHGMIHRALGWEEPAWVHLSVFLKPSGKGKMSKREKADLMKDGHSIFIKDLQSLGYLPEAVVNWISLMGWSYDDHTEFFNLPDLVDKFSLQKLNPSPAAINFSKLDHFNGLHIRSLTHEDLARRIKPFFMEKGFAADDATLLRIAPIIQEHIATLDEAVDFAGFFFKDEITPVPENLIAKGLTARQSAEIAEKSLAILAALPDLRLETAEPPMRKLLEESGFSAGQVFGIMREAITGQRVSPPLFESMEIVGRETVLARMENAIRLLKGLPE
ncbi:glutamyl-tRNA synthetase [Longilinea arvoryzae]|uniref:Glutamate--tRNA ligase n=1 Tax=Longilinea arvoryzae TaxID=360412 RepID=A0A0S7BK43_9CHLR|nr:glutamate--tRNA ligase [Longilinea arvoryzae]GAP14870.1 glutamyl-tRNA synthetase [Longilinea arvoryzae]